MSIKDLREMTMFQKLVIGLLAMGVAGVFSCLCAQVASPAGTVEPLRPTPTETPEPSPTATPVPEPTATPMPTQVLGTPPSTLDVDQADVDYVLCHVESVLPDAESMLVTMQLATAAMQEYDYAQASFWGYMWLEDLETVKESALACPLPADELLLKARSDLLAALDEMTEAANHGKRGIQLLDPDEFLNAAEHMERGQALIESSTDALNAYRAQKGF